jgi:hypothetical protein
MPKEADMEQKGTGAISEQIATVDDIDLSAVSWFGSRILNTLSTYVGAKPGGQKKNLKKKERKTQYGSMSSRYHYIQ